jgi:hypothetical protein
VAINPHTSVDTLDALSDDPDALVRSNLARNMSTSDETVMKLSNDCSFGVRKSTAESGRI